MDNYIKNDIRRIRTLIKVADSIEDIKELENIDMDILDYNLNFLTLDQLKEHLETREIMLNELDNKIKNIENV